MRKIVLAAAFLLVTTPAFAQDMGVGVSLGSEAVGADMAMSGTIKGPLSGTARVGMTIDEDVFSFVGLGMDLPRGLISGMEYETQSKRFQLTVGVPHFQGFVVLDPKGMNNAAGVSFRTSLMGLLGQ